VKKGQQTSTFFLVLLVVLLAYMMIPVEADNMKTNIHITSPIQNHTYQSNIIPLNYTLETNIERLPNITVQNVGFVYNLDGQPGYHDGHAAGGDFFYPPLPSNYSTTLNLPNGNHTLWVGALFRFKINATNNMIYYSSSESLSQIVNFEVSATSSPNPSPSVPEYPILAIVIPFIVSLAFTLVLKRRLLVISR
jgi:hypothetical protein